MTSEEFIRELKEAVLKIELSAICDSIYAELQKSGKHMVMERRKREIK